MRIPALLLVAGCLFGCGRQTPETAPVTGTVTLNGKPLAEGNLVFHPPQGRPAYGQIRKGEILDVFTTLPGDGAPIGSYPVTVHPAPSRDMYAQRPLEIPARYAKADESGIVADVRPRQDNRLEIRLRD